MTFHELCASSRSDSEWVRVRVLGPQIQDLRAHELHLGPLIGRWNFFLERHFPLRPLGGANPGKVSLRALARRVGADQLFM